MALKPANRPMISEPFGIAHAFTTDQSWQTDIPDCGTNPLRRFVG
jgi:hypothetical protein